MSKSIVVLTGAGISQESGIKTFRDHNGLWENHRVEEVASIEGFQANPDLVQSFYNARRAQLMDAAVQPNSAHFALAQLEKEWKGNFLLVTQNVDDLHERAGSEKLIHMHGELLKVRCVDTQQVFPWRSEITRESTCPCCLKTRTLRPHIVWFGEIPLEMDRIYDALESCDIFISIGTSGQVYPAAGFVAAVPPHCQSIEVNADSTPISNAFKRHLTGLAGSQVPKLAEELLLK